MIIENLTQLAQAVTELKQRFEVPPKYHVKEDFVYLNKFLKATNDFLYLTLTSVTSIIDNLDDIVTIATNINELLEVNDSAVIAQQQALIATTQANIATASEANTLSYKTDAESALDNINSILNIQLKEYASIADFPVTGNEDTIYIALDTSYQYRWSGTQYNKIGNNVILGETETTAYRGDRGKIAYDHSQLTHDKSFVGLSNVDNTSDADKPISIATQSALDLKAPLDSPNLVTPNIGVASGISFNDITGLSSVSPNMDGTASAGISTLVAREDHIHPNDTSKQDILVSNVNIKTVGGVSLLGSGNIDAATSDSPTLTGIPTAPTAPAGTSTTQIATTAFVTSSPEFTGIPTAPTAEAGTSTSQIATTAFVTTADNLKAPLESPELTGIPTAPTAAIGTNTTQIATTAFVITADNNLQSQINQKAPLDSPELTGIPTAPTAVGNTNNTQIATTAMVHSAIKNDLNVTGTAPMYVCRAWVNFDGTLSSLVPRKSGNVSSMIKNGTGNYTINFISSMPDANYIGVVTVGNDASAANQGMVGWCYSYTTSSLHVGVTNNNDDTSYDRGITNVAIFG